MAENLIHKHLGQPVGGHHECEILGRGPEAAESGARWKECKKNPGHEEFISVPDFIDNYLPKVRADKHRDWFRAVIDLTVRLRVNWTSPDRSDEDNFSILRGSDVTRLGTGFVWNVGEPNEGEPCPCELCRGEVWRKFWTLEVQTANHIVYNNEESETTRVDLFYDYDGSCKYNGGMKSLSGSSIRKPYSDRDVCYLSCVTHDEALIARLKSAKNCWWDGKTCIDQSDLDMFSSHNIGDDPVLIVSHPHGQPKKITVGEGKDGESPLVEYNTATCPGSSGAPVFRLSSTPTIWRYLLWHQPVHGGHYTTMSTQRHYQLNLHLLFPKKRKGPKTKPAQINYGSKW